MPDATGPATDEVDLTELVEVLEQAVAATYEES